MFDSREGVLAFPDQLCDPDVETHGPRKPQRRSLRRAIVAGDVEVDG